MTNVMAITGAGARVTISEKSMEELRKSVHGQVIVAGDPSYDEARAVWNGMIDKRPAVIVRCIGTADVIASVNFARENNLLVAVRGGGHNVSGAATCDDGLVIDLGPMKGVHVDVDKKTVRAQGGCTLFEVNRETQIYNMATPLGAVSETGIAGLTLSGGMGWLTRSYGLSCDNLVSADVVIAEGKVVKASESQNADLFWGLRGGGGNFGIVTSFEYKLYPVGPELFVCLSFYPAEKGKEIMKKYREFMAKAGDKINSICFYGNIPPAPFFPPEIQGKPFFLVAGCYPGPVAEGEKLLQPLRGYGETMADLSGPFPYLALNSMFDEDYPAGELRYYWKSIYINALSDEAIDVLAEQAVKKPSRLTTLDVWTLGGVMGKVGPEAMAFRNRKSPYLIGIEANWPEPKDDQANISWARETVERLRPFSDGSQYLNFPGFYEEGDKTLRTTYGPNYDRLVALKKKYDPRNLFRLNQNIKLA